MLLKIETVPEGEIPPAIQTLLKMEGVFLSYQPERPGIMVPLWVSGGKVYSMKIDEALDPTRFIDNCLIEGPFNPTA